MVPVTARFQAESALHPAARAVLLDAFDQGWADPKKLHHQSRQAAILLQESKESIAEDLDLLPSEIHFLGELDLGFHLAIMGLTQPADRIFYSAIDRQEVLAIMSHFPNSFRLEVDRAGLVALPNLLPQDVLVWQSVNGETGLYRPQVQAISSFGGNLFVDHTAYPTLATAFPGWSTALWESSSWSGPSGLSIFGLKSMNKNWRNPLPRLDQSTSPSGFSLPLVIASAVALKAWKKDEIAQQQKIDVIAQRIRAFIRSNISDVDMVEDGLDRIESMISLSFLYVDAEKLQSDLAKAGFDVDSGSACTSINLESSHVLKAMGLLSQGNIRLRLHHDLSAEAVESFLVTLQLLVEEQRQ